MIIGSWFSFYSPQLQQTVLEVKRKLSHRSMVWRLQHLRSDGINLIAILAVVTFYFFFLLVSMIMSLLSIFWVPMYTEICTPPKIFLKSSPAKLYLVWIITISRKARIIERIFMESQISCRYPFSVSLYFLIFLSISK